MLGDIKAGHPEGVSRLPCGKGIILFKEKTQARIK